MTEGVNRLSDEIRNWLRYHPITEEQGLDVYGIPPMLFDLTGTDDRLKLLNRQIQALPLQQRKLLQYLSRNIDPALIIESMEYASPELFWLDKAVLIKEVDPTARQQEVQQVFAVNESLLGEIYRISDEMDIEAEKAKARKYRKWMLLGIPPILALLYFLVYPLVIKPQPMELYEQYKDAFRPDLSRIDTLSTDGRLFSDAWLTFKEGEFSESARLFEELISTGKEFRSQSRWFLALINLHEGDGRSGLEQLNALRSEDPEFFRRVAQKLYQEF